MALQVTGGTLVAGQENDGVGTAFVTRDPRSGRALEPPMRASSPLQIAAAVDAAEKAAATLAAQPPAVLVGLLEALADTLDANSNALVERADAETALGSTRLSGEVARTSGQLRMFATAVREGSYLEVVLDPARTSPPRPDLRRMLVPVGPVAVFGASNFPLAFGVLGGDSASALAAGCPVVAKAHPSNAGTSALVARLVSAVVAGLGLPPGTFSLVQGAGPEVGTALATAPGVAALGFTGSLAGGRALFDLACSRPHPIPVYAEMGSTNPLVITPGALARRGGAIADGLAASVLLGSGQFCTKPGLVLVPDDETTDGFLETLSAAVAAQPPGVLLDSRIRDAFTARAGTLAALPGVRVHVGGETGQAGGPDGRRSPEEGEGMAVAARVLSCTLTDLRTQPLLREECFGPLVVAVRVPPEELITAAGELEGSLTASVHSEPEEVELAAALVAALRTRAGRVIHDGYPTGVAVSWAMSHTGPYPATTAPTHTSVGVTALRRFLRPVTYQDMPAALLHPAVRDDNPWALPRRVDGVLELAGDGLTMETHIT